MHNKDLLLDLAAVFERKDPLRPGIQREFLNAPRAVGLHDIRRIELRGERICTGSRFHPGVEAVDEDQTARGRLGRC